MRHKHFQIPLLLFFVSLLASCEKMMMEEAGGQGTNSTNHNVVIRVADMDAGWDGANSRAQVPISEVCSRLQFAVYKDGSRVKSENQIVGDGSFGVLSLQLEPGAYQLLVLGHSGAANVTTTKPEKLQFTNPTASNGTGFTDTFYHYGDMVVSSEGAQVDISMKRATSMFRLKTNDGKPGNVKKFQFYYTGGSGALDAITGLGCVNSKQTVPVTLEDSLTGRPLTFEMYTILRQESAVVTFTVTAYDDSDNVLYTKEFKAQMRRNCITQYTGSFFTSGEGDTPDTPVVPPSDDDDVPPFGETSSGFVYVDPEWADVFEYTY